MYKRVIMAGSLSETKEVYLHPCWTVDTWEPEVRRFPAEAQDATIGVDFVDGEGRILLRNILALFKPCAISTSEKERPTQRVFMGAVPFVEDVRAVHLIYDDQLIHEFQVPETEPHISWRWDPDDTLEGKQEVRWAGEHSTVQPLYYRLFYSSDDGASWSPVSLPTTESVEELNFDELPGGKGRLRLSATDGFNTVSIDSAGFSVNAKPCWATILFPPDDWTTRREETLWFVGQGFYREEDRVELESLRWHSSIDGDFGKGPLVDGVGLSPGKHVITLTTGSGDREGLARVRVTIRD